MRHCAFLCALTVALAGCPRDEKGKDRGTLSEPPTSATQIMLRVDAVAYVRKHGADLRVGVARLENQKTWVPTDFQRISFKDFSGWPVDLPIRPAKPEDGQRPLEVVVDVLDVDGLSIAETRAITEFVPHHERRLDVVLRPCQGAMVCESNPSCHGTECLTCVNQTCVQTPFIAGTNLQDLNEPYTFEPGDGDGDDGGANNDPCAFPACPPTCTTDAGVCPDSCPDASACPECDPQSAGLKCSEATPSVPLFCDSPGFWRPNTSAFDGKQGCIHHCLNGHCAECASQLTRCVENQLQHCGEDFTWVDDSVCRSFCQGTKCAQATSCGAAFDLDCASGDSCCRSLFVPGGTFKRGIDTEHNDVESIDASVSDFRLDRFEVTVSRISQWLHAYNTNGKPLTGSGANPNDPEDHGWQAEWTEQLPADSEVLLDGITKCIGTTWSEIEDAGDLPMNCLNWYEAFAFCVWDGGRLPTEAEWNYAAAAGNQQRPYPWSTFAQPLALDASKAAYNGAQITHVGSFADGDGLWGQADLAGNVSEWVRDDYQEGTFADSCSDCVQQINLFNCKVFRGGWAGGSGETLLNSSRDCAGPKARVQSIGFRCARK